MKSKLPIAILGLILLSGLGYALTFWLNLGNSVGYSPEQPIPFSHKIHAGDNKIPCLYCHVNADKSRHSTVPSVNVCMNCHSVVKADPNPLLSDGKPNPGYSPYIDELKKKYAKGESIEWVKVHDQPDFVFFNHKRHVLKGVACDTCHGDVKQMSKIEQVKTLNMGFCVDCHKKNDAPLQCYTCHH